MTQQMQESVSSCYRYRGFGSELGDAWLGLALLAWGMDGRDVTLAGDWQAWLVVMQHDLKHRRRMISGGS